MYVLAVRKERLFNKGVDQQINQATITKELFSIMAEDYKILRVEDLKAMDFTTIDFYTTTRTDYSNEVIADKRTDEFAFKYVPEFSNGMRVPIFDAIMLSAQKTMFKCLSPDCDFNKLIVRTQCVPMGAMNLNRPLIYTTIVIDTKLKDESYFTLNQGYKFEPIQKYQFNIKTTEKNEMQKKLFIVKERPNNE